MNKKFEVGDHVKWNSEAGHVSGKIIKIHTRDTEYKGHTHHASPDDPQYEIKSDKTDHVAMHKGLGPEQDQPLSLQFEITDCRLDVPYWTRTVRQVGEYPVRADMLRLRQRIPWFVAGALLQATTTAAVRADR